MMRSSYASLGLTLGGLLLALVPVAACESSDSGGGSTAFDAGAGSTFDGSTALDGSTPADAAVVDAAADAADAADAAAPDVALRFDGVAAQVEMTTSVAGPNTTAFTVEAWFNTTQPTGTFFEVYGAEGGADRFLFLSAGTVCFYVYDVNPTQICSMGAEYNDGKWHHAAGTLGAIGGTRVYIDGVLDTASPEPTQSSYTLGTLVRLGFGHSFFDSPTAFYQGQLDEVRMWSVERSAADILASYKTHIPGTTAGLQGYWKLDESGVATTAKDSAADPHDGTLTGFVTPPSPWVSPGAF